ncbi:hypothetical protein FHG87_006587 [Trinorchestia longiramus]|nr:hypothetical protein FHG87_006587 [Trinorchestia longiramus]
MTVRKIVAVTFIWALRAGTAVNSCSSCSSVPAYKWQLFVQLRLDDKGLVLLCILMQSMAVRSELKAMSGSRFEVTAASRVAVQCSFFSHVSLCLHFGEALEALREKTFVSSRVTDSAAFVRGKVLWYTTGCFNGHNSEGKKNEINAQLPHIGTKHRKQLNVSKPFINEKQCCVLVEDSEKREFLKLDRKTSSDSCQLPVEKAPSTEFNNGLLPLCCQRSSTSPRKAPSLRTVQIPLSNKRPESSLFKSTQSSAMKIKTKKVTGKGLKRNKSLSSLLADDGQTEDGRSCAAIEGPSKTRVPDTGSISNVGRVDEANEELSSRDRYQSRVNNSQSSDRSIAYDSRSPDRDSIATGSRSRIREKISCNGWPSTMTSGHCSESQRPTFSCAFRSQRHDGHSKPSVPDHSSMHK